MQEEDAKLKIIVDDVAQVVGLFKRHLPGNVEGWLKSYHVADCVGAYLEVLDEVRPLSNEPSLRPQVVEWDGGCWVEAYWRGQPIVLDFSDDEPVVVATDHPAYVEMREVSWKN